MGTATPAHADDKNDEYRVSVFSTYALTEDRRWVGIGDLEYRWNQDGTYDVDYIGLGTIWNFKPKMEAWFTLIGTYTDNDSAPDVEELRPAVRFRNYFKKTKALRFYNMARLEYRIQHRDQGGEDTEYFRLPDRLGVEVSLGPKGKESRLHGIADIEPFYRFDRDTLDPLRLRVGLGWIMHDLVHAEFTYSMSFARDGSGDSLEWTENIWQLNFKVARQKGLLNHLFVEEGGL